MRTTDKKDSHLRIPLCFPGQTLLASLHEVIGPCLVKALSDTFSMAQLGNAVCATQAVQNNAYFLLRTVLFARLALDVTNGLF
jgi:hypothetical protein